MGDELLCGDVINSNAAYLSNELDALGISTLYHCAIRDDATEIAEEFNKAYSKADIILLTGGLGPTKDDLTKETVSDALGLEMEMNEEAKKHIHDYFKKVNRPESSNNLKQCYIPKGSTAIINKNGTAPGIYLERDGKIIALFPGPPNEVIPMFEEFVNPRLRSLSKNAYAEKYYMFSGIGEAVLEDTLRKAIAEEDSYTLNTYITQSGIRLRAVASAENTAEAQKKIDGHDALIKELLGKWLYAEEKQEIWQTVTEKLMQRNLTIACAESCTGGLFASLLTRTAGVSSVFSGGMVTYSNEVKHRLLGVKEETLNEYGAVSKETAEEMALKIREKFSCDIGVGITGLAGPSAGYEKEPVGCVFICINFKGISEVMRKVYIGSRTSVQMRSAVSSFKMIDEMLKKY